MRIFYASFVFLLTFSFASAQLDKGETEEKVIKEKLHKYLGEPTNVGKDFWLSVPPPLTQESVGWENFTRFFIVASGDANVRLEQAAGISQNMFVPAGAVRAFNLKPGECQPFLYAYSGSTLPPPAQVYTGKGIHITSDQPVVVYVVIRYRWTTDGYLAIPTQSLGTKYISSVYDGRPFGSSSLPNMHTIVGAYDKTKVTVTLGGGVNSLTVQLPGNKEAHSGDVLKWTINKGDVIVISNKGPQETLSGSLIETDKPVASISGQFCTDITVFERACDYTVEMDLPMELWGQIYPITLIKQRKKPSWLRVFAKEPNTLVWRDGQEYAFFTQGVGAAGGTQNNAWIEQRVWPTGLDPATAVLTSDKPIYVCLYNPSQSDDNILSDPFSMIQTPIEQYQNKITFSTPSAPGGLPFALNWLNIVMEADENNLVPEDMEFGRVNEDGTVDWKTVRSLYGANLDLYFPIGTGSDTLIFKDSKYKGKVFGQKHIDLTDGAYAIRSKNIFACYSYGYDQYDSYGYPTSTALRVISEDVDPPMIFWTMDCDGNIQGTTTDAPDPDSVPPVRVGLSIPEVDWDYTENYDLFKYDNSNFVPGVKTTAWSLNIVDKDKPAKTIVIFYDRSGNVSRDTITYDPELIDLREVVEYDQNGDLYEHSHGVVGLNELKTMRYEIQNMSISRTFTLKEVKLKFKDQNFKIEPLGWDINTPFAPKEIRPFTVTFQTAMEGRFLDSIGLSTECTDQYFARIMGETGIPGITVDDYDFPVQVLNASGTNPPVFSTDLRISNKCNGSEGTQPLIITGFKNPTNPDFKHNLNTLVFPLTIQPGEQVSFKVNFTATAVGNFNDSIVFETDKDLGCDPVCLITAKVIKPGIIAQDFDYGKVRIDYSKQAHTYQPTNDLITVANSSTGDDAANLTINNIVFTPVTGNIGDFSFENNFASSLPSNTMNNFKNVQVKPGEKTTPQKMVYFRPQTVGAYEFNYHLENTAEEVGSETKYVVKGYGVVPNMTLYYDNSGTQELNDVGFGTITSGVPSEAVTRTLRIVNAPTDPANGDSLTITAINWGAGISTNIADLGNVPFIVDEAKLLNDYGTNGAYPIVLNINEELTFDVTFYSNTPGSFASNVTVVSDADETGNTGVFNGDININGDAVRPRLNLVTTDLYSCLSNPLNVDQTYPNYQNMFTVTNSGSKDVTVKKLEFVPSDGNATGYTFKVNSGILKKADGSADVTVPNTGNITLDNITMAPNDKLIVLVTYIPSVEYAPATPKKIKMVLTTDIVNVDDQPVPSEFDLTSDSFIRKSSSVVKRDDGQPLTEKVNFTIKPHRNLTYAVSLDNITPATDLKDAGLTTLQVGVEYRRSYLTYDNAQGVELIGDYKNKFDIIDLNTSMQLERDASRDNKYNVIETISFQLVAKTGNIINAGGDVFRVHFKSGLPNLPDAGYTIGGVSASVDSLYLEGRDQVGNMETYIKTSMFDPTGNSCGQIVSPDQITLDLDPVCGMGYRPLELSNYNNNAGLVSPNPVTSAGGKIEFSLAFDSETIVRIVNSTGEVVAVLNDSKLSAGNHTIAIPVDKLSNGTYYYEINSPSTNLNERNGFVVVK